MGSADLKEVVLVKSTSSFNFSEICSTLSSCNSEKFHLSPMILHLLSYSILLLSVFYGDIPHGNYDVVSKRINGFLLYICCEGLFCKLQMTFVLFPLQSSHSFCSAYNEIIYSFCLLRINPGFPVVLFSFLFCKKILITVMELHFTIFS